MKIKTKRILAIASAALVGMSLLLPSAVSAMSYNADDYCKTVATIKKAANPVVHDGVITPGEYEEIDINRDEDTTDLLLCYMGDTQYTLACELLKNIHFYISWDEINGLNLAVSGNLIETPRNLNTSSEWPEDKFYWEEADVYSPSDEFIFQYGAMFYLQENIGTKEEPEYEGFINNGFTRNTETGELLFGWYWVFGYGDYLKTNRQQPERDYNCSYNLDTHEVVFEISYPFAAALKGDQYNGNTPVEGSEVYFGISLVGGGVGTGSTDAASYVVSLGDGGYISSQGSSGHPATGVFSLETVGGGTVVNPNPTQGSGTVINPDPTQGGGTVINPDPTQGGGTVINPDPTQGGSTVVNPDPTQGGGTVVNPDPTQGGDTTTPGSPTVRPGSTVNPSTGDAMLILAAVSALSAGGAMIFKKRR